MTYVRQNEGENMNKELESICENPIVENVQNEVSENTIRIDEDGRILGNPVQVYSVIQRLRKVRRIYPKMNRQYYALIQLAKVIRFLNTCLSDYTIKYDIENLDNAIRFFVTIEIYNERVTEDDEYLYTFTILRKAFPELSDMMVHRLTLDVLGKFPKTNVNEENLEEYIEEILKRKGHDNEDMVSLALLGKLEEVEEK